MLFGSYSPSRVSFPQHSPGKTALLTTRTNEVSNYRLCLKPKRLDLCLTCSHEAYLKNKTKNIQSHSFFFFFFFLIHLTVGEYYGINVVTARTLES